MTLREDINTYIKKTYGSEPEYLWQRYPDYAVYRHGDNRKWFGIIMNVTGDKLGMADARSVDIINVKLEDLFLRSIMIQQDGYFRGWHMGGNWVSILLDGTVPLKEICSMIDESYIATASRETKHRLRPPKEWLIPANPAYYDIVHAFDETDTIEWKQGAGIRKGDTVYMYVGAPVSAIMYKCRVLETDIPYEYADENLTIRALMKVKLQKRFKPERFTFRVLKEEYGIRAVRGPRGIPASLSEALKR